MPARLAASAWKVRMRASAASASNYAAALLVPYGSVLATTQSLRYDVDAVAVRFGVSSEQAAHRLLIDPNQDTGEPWRFVADRTGTPSG